MTQSSLEDLQELEYEQRQYESNVARLEKLALAKHAQAQVENVEQQLDDLIGMAIVLDRNDETKAFANAIARYVVLKIFIFFLVPKP